jgi:nitrite reductase (NO-forming)
MHRQTRPGLAMCAAFAMAAALAAFAPHNTGAWLPLHLFLVGAVLHAISAVTVMLAVTWSAAMPPPWSAVRLQRWLLTVGVVVLAAGREMAVAAVAVPIAAAAIAASLVILGVLLARVRRDGPLDRFDAAIDGYLIALALALGGSAVGAVVGTGNEASNLVSVHLTLNLLGFVGVVIAATLPYMTATQFRSKMTSRATPKAIRTVVGVMAGATVVAAIGIGTRRELLAGLGLLAYAGGIAGTIAICPIPRWRNVRWAGPRVGCLALGALWWFGACVGFAACAWSAVGPPTGLVIALVVGGYAQILVGSLAYLAPVLRGGGHAHLAQGFRLTRAWPALVAANVAAAGAVFGSSTVALAGIAIVVGDAAVRAALLARPMQGVT